MKALNILMTGVWLLACQANVAVAQVLPVKTFSVSIKGTSSLHDWESSVEKVEAKGSFSITNSNLSDIRDVIVRIPVKSIKSTKGKMMDNKTWEAFNADKNPVITFVLSERKINTGKGVIEARGTLTMAGTTRPVELIIPYSVLPGGELRVTGTKKLLMSDFRMEPPTAMMGTIKVGDEVEVAFDIVLNPMNSL